MASKIKVVNRNIANSDNCRCKYGKPISFDILQVNISYNGETLTYQIDSKYLSHDKDSIYFYPSIKNGILDIQWNKEVADYIHRIR
ncbi:MAG: hypothetical protein IKX24_04795 [Prevotella sp.]|nr:hypothetical protein [Prevotella sp.]